jgi:RimJ/RimL family protein N-acetyltransferase
MIMNYIIEKVKQEEAQELLWYLKRIGGESDNLSFGAEGLPLSVEQEQEYIRGNINSDKNVMFVAKRDGKIIGDCSFSSLPRRFSHRGKIGMAVLKEYWNHGIGTNLLEMTIAFAKEIAKAEVISLEVRSDNTRAIALYKKIGFQKIGRFKKFFKINGEYYDADLMNLYL